MNEKIYLGFAGKENLRLGESLAMIDKFVFVIKQYMEPVPIEKLEKYISNPYIMYNIKDINMLINVFNYSTGTILVGGVTNTNRKSKLDIQKETDYIISLVSFKFFSEKVWPRVVENFIKNIQHNKNCFILRLNFPLDIIKKIYRYEKDMDYIKLFTYEFSKWLGFHFIGNISKISDENENIIIYLDVRY